jgi:osmotically-inducible protein OsmY
LGKIEATLEGNRTVVLRGRVATEADRQLAEGLARLEPAAMAVRNELVVGSAPGTTAEAVPPPPAAGTP